MFQYSLNICNFVSTEMGGILTFIDFKNEVSRGNIKQIYFVSSVDSYFVNEASKLLRTAIFGDENNRENYFVRYADEMKYNELLDLCSNFPSLFSQKKIVFVKGAEKLGKNLNHIFEYSKVPSDDTILLVVFDANYANENKLFRDHTFYDFCSLPGEKLADWIREEFAKHECIIGDNEISLFTSSAPSSFSIMKEEIDKISNYAGEGSVIKADAILKSLGFDKTYTPDELIKAILDRNIRRSMDTLHYLLYKSGINEVYLVSLFTTYFADLMILKTAGNLDYSALYTKYRLWRGRVEFAKKYHDKMQISQISKVFELLISTDHQLKTTMIEPKTLVTALVENLLKV